jgi:hypothetical protein
MHIIFGSIPEMIHEEPAVINEEIMHNIMTDFMLIVVECIEVEDIYYIPFSNSEVN